jgi:C-terminal processing protease CtpA/Prc
MGVGCKVKFRALKIAFSPALCGLFFCAFAAHARANDVLADFDFLWETVEKKYVYLDAARWQCVRERSRPRAQAATREDALALFENAIESLTDFHAHLNINNAKSWRLIPSGSDVRARLDDQGRAVVEAVRARSSAASAGIRVGDTVVSVANVPTAQAIDAHLARFPCLDRTQTHVREWALQRLLAGTHAGPRALTLTQVDGMQRNLWLPAPKVDELNTSIKRLPDGTAIITITEVGNDETVTRFHAQLARVMDAPALILDLRETATGGNTSVAEPILARFITAESDYQRITPRDGATWNRKVKPDTTRATYDKPIAIVVGRWTASMGEGMAIGLNALRNAPVVGAPMAGLRGGVETFTLPKSGWRFTIPTVKLSHIDGTPRENFKPIEADRNAYGTAMIYEAARRAMSANPPPR